MNDTTPKIPWLRPRVREIVEELFQSQSQWKRNDLMNHACRIHESRNGQRTDRPVHTLGRVLKDMRKEGLISTSGHGFWLWNGELTDNDDGINVSDLVETAEIDEPIFPAEKEIGEGSECVYVYFNPNDKKLAQTEERDSWECKVGRTSSSSVPLRLISQGVNTALSRPPILGLIIRTDDSRLIEKILHDSLRLVSSDIDESIGNEWFMTSPEIIEKWYLVFQSSIETLRGNTISRKRNQNHAMESTETCSADS